MRPTPLFIVLAVLLTGIPFIQQAYTIDGPTFVAVAKHLQRHPTRLVDFRYDHLGERVDHYILEMTHPPVWPYMLAGAWEVSGGETEEVSHLLTLLMAIVAGVAMYLLARRLGVPPITAGIVLVTTPPFLVLSHTVMAEVPALALSLLGVWLFLRYRDDPGWRNGLLAGAALALAVGVAYQSAVILVALALSSPRRRWSPLYFPVAGITVWILAPWVAGAESPLTAGLAPYVETVAGNPTSWYPIKAACTLSYLGLCPFFLVAAFPSIRFRAAIVAAILLFLAGAGIYRLGEIDPGLPGTLFFGLLFAIGAGTVYRATRAGWREGSSIPDPESRLLLGWLWTALLFSVFILNFAAVRHTLLLLPPIILLLLRRPSGMIASRVSIGASLVVGLLLSVADARFAEASRTMPTGLPAPFEGGSTVHAHYSSSGACRVNAEWGLRHYREEQGLPLLFPVPRPLEGGVRFIMPTETANVPLPPRLANSLTMIAEVPIEDDFPIRMMHAGVRAGFYCHGWGMLPFAISTRPVETLRVYEVNRFLSGIGEARIPTEGGMNRHAPATGTVEVGGVAKSSLFLHPPGEIGFRRDVHGPGARLRFLIGIPEAAWQQGGDGVEFEVSIAPYPVLREAGWFVGWSDIPDMDRRKVVYSRYLDPRRNPGDRGWQEEVVDLGTWDPLWSRPVEIIFTTRSGPAGDDYCDWAVWADQRLE